jgi:hypothetical protein
MAELMTVIEASHKSMKAYAFDDDPKMIVVYVLDMSGSPVFAAIRNYAGKWKHAENITFGDLEADYHLILDFDKVKALVTEAKKSLSV